MELIKQSFSNLQYSLPIYWANMKSATGFDEFLRAALSYNQKENVIYAVLGVFCILMIFITSRSTKELPQDPSQDPPSNVRKRRSSIAAAGLIKKAENDANRQLTVLADITFQYMLNNPELPAKDITKMMGATRHDIRQSFYQRKKAIAAIYDLDD